MPRPAGGVNRGPEGHGARPTIELVPESGVERLSPTAFRAGTDEPWLAVKLGRPVPAGRWVRVRYRAGLLQDPVRPLLRMRDRQGRSGYEIMAGPVCGAAWWTWRIPPGTVSLAVSPVASAGAFAFSLDELRTIGRLRLFAGALRRKPGLALHAAWLRLAGRRVRARHFVKSIWASTPLRDYPGWRAARLANPLPDPEPAVWSESVTIAIDAGRAEPGEVERTRASLSGQGAEVVEFAGEALPEVAPGWVGIVRAGDTLEPGGLAAFAARARRDPSLAAMYCDEDVVDRDGRPLSVRLKPDWSPRLQAGTGYLGGLVLARTVSPLMPLQAGIQPGSPDPGFRRGERGSVDVSGMKVGHVRRVLYHRPEPYRPRKGSTPAPQAEVTAEGRPRSTRDGGASVEARPPASPDRLAPQDEDVGSSGGHAPDSLMERVLVSVVIPTRDRLDLLRLCVEGLRSRTAYPALDILIVDNGSEEPETLAYYVSLASDGRVRVLSRPDAFNFSALCNEGVAAARGEVVVLLNNDVEVIGPDWLDHLVAEAVRPEIGAVGARLLYPDGRLQHGGVAIGLGGAAGHVGRGRPGDEAGWLGRLAVPHEVSAVTGACLAVGRDTYRALGGLDAEHLPISFNDIDFCLKLRRAGYINLMVPAATLTHHESASRGRDVAGARQARAEREAAIFAERWLPAMRDDPYFHPGLSLLRFDTALG